MPNRGCVKSPGPRGLRQPDCEITQPPLVLLPSMVNGIINMEVPSLSNYPILMLDSHNFGEALHQYIISPSFSRDSPKNSMWPAFSLTVGAALVVLVQKLAM